MGASVKKRLLLIGAGPTSSLICFNIAKNKLLKDALDIHIWEKARGIGGRFSTSRSPKNPDCCVDLGAQYLTLSQGHKSSSGYFENLKQHNLIRPLETVDIPGFRFDPSKTHFTCVKGSASIVKHFFEQASIAKNDIKFSHRVTKITPTPSGTLNVSADNGNQDVFDIVVSTIPVPQVLQLENVSEIITDGNLKQNLEAVKYSTRYALGLFFNTNVQLKSSNKPINFVENDDIVRYWSIENLKRTGNYMEPTSVVLHTSIGFGAENAEVEKDSIKPQLLQKAINIVPETVNIQNDADAVKCHKWRYSQVLESYPGKPGCVHLIKQIIAAGDSFSQSGLEGCIDSAEQAIISISRNIL